MKRGDVVTVAVPGDYGKPRPAVIVQSDAFPPEHASVVICQMTSHVVPEAEDFRISIAPTPENGLQMPSQIMADKPVAVRRERVAAVIGRLTGQDMARLNAALAFVMGLTDAPAP